MTYKHGVYADIIPSGETPSPSGVSTYPVYIGTAPIQKLDLTDYSNKINTPILISSLEDARNKIGVSDDWDKFTLSEAVDAHFNNVLGSIGPIIVINFLDPDTHNSSETVNVTLTNNVGYIDDFAVLDTVAIADKVRGTDFEVEYVGDRVKLTAITTISSPVSVTYDAIDTSVIVNDDITDAIDSVDNTYRILGKIATILAAPNYSKIPAIALAMATKCANKISEKFAPICVVDIDSGDADAQTIDNSIIWKNDKAYTSKFMKVCWPKVKFLEKIYNLSTMIVATMQRVDYVAGSPYISCSNQQIQIDAPVLEDGTEVIFDEKNANKLNAAGITTVNYSGGTWKTWGPHMGNYSSDNLANIEAEDRVDASIRMLQYLHNEFQVRYLGNIDGPMSRRIIENILTSAKQWLNSMVSLGELLYADIAFQESSNSNGDVTNGDFVFDVRTTTTPVAKSITFKVQYTTTGITSLFGGE